MLIKVLIFVPLYCVWVMGTLSIVFGVFTQGLPAGEVPLPAILIYLILLFPPIWLFGKWMNWVPRWVKKVEADGKPATATILSVKNTGIVINNTVAVVKLQLRVEPRDEAPFEVSQQKQISMLSGLGGFYAGAHLQVKYDPDNKKHVVILSDSDVAPSYKSTRSSSATSRGSHQTNSASADPELTQLSQYESNLSSADFAQELSNRSKHQAGSSRADIAQELASLANLHKRGDLSDSEFEAAKKKLLG